MKNIEKFILKIVLLFSILFTMFYGFNTSKVYASDFADWKFELNQGNGEGGKEGEGATGNIEIKITDKNGLLDESVSKGSVWNILLNRYKVGIVIFGSIGVLTLIFIGIILFTKLSASAANPQKRKDTITWIGILMVAAGLLGSVMVIFSYTYGVFN